MQPTYKESQVQALYQDSHRNFFKKYAATNAANNPSSSPINNSNNNQQLTQQPDSLKRYSSNANILPTTPKYTQQPKLIPRYGSASNLLIKPSYHPTIQSVQKPKDHVRDKQDTSKLATNYTVYINSKPTPYKYNLFSSIDQPCNRCCAVGSCGKCPSNQCYPHQHKSWN